ncbi:probable tRNA pseudouridine synthase 1 isoform X4 [Octodon degus]|uniref:tRNA pseudouridine(55) synthase n=1 Tax=Octodon degus TaxID=10160 RepID=A0A6P6EH95_OCTDE|nr:probable tRNA pseudouridine synthase 1 isoform X4 [Octodon degus]
MAAGETAVLSSPLKTDVAHVCETAETGAAMARKSVSAAAAAAIVASAGPGCESRVSKSALATKLLSLSGVFAVHKPRGPTSAELLNRLKEKLLAEAGMPSSEWTKRKKQTLKIGHGGTLDSAARGILDKITQEDIEGILRKFTGNIMQIPPLYSALKKDGQRLSALMKRGKVVEAKPARPVTVYSISLEKFQPPFFTIAIYLVTVNIPDVECGGGFYIRSLVSDIGKELSSCASVLELTRTKQGPFTLEEHALPEDKWTIDDIAQCLERCSALFPAELALKKSKPEESNAQGLSCECVALNETKEEGDVIKTV